MQQPAVSGPAITGVEANIWKYYFFQFLLNLQLWWPIWIIYLTEERGLTLAQVTLIDVPFWICTILLQVPAAAMSDRWGRKPTLIAAAATMGLAVTLFGLAASFWLLLVSYLIWGVSFALLFGTESAFVFDSLKAMGRESEYTKVYGRAWGLAAAATLTGTLAGAPIAAATSLPFPIIVSGGVAIGAALFALSLAEPSQRTASSISYGRILADSAKLVRTNPSVRHAILFYGAVTIGGVGPVFFFQPFLLEHGIDVGNVGYWQTPTRIAGIVGAVSAAAIISWMGERGTFYAMPVALIAAYLLLGLWDSVYAQVAFPIMNFTVILSQPTITDYLHRRVDTEQRATVVSLTNLIRSLALIPAAPLLGALAVESLKTAFFVGGLLIAGTTLPLLLVWSRYLGIRLDTEAIMIEPAEIPSD